MPPQKTELLLIHTLNPSISRRPRKIQINSDAHTEVISIIDASTPKPTWFRSLDENQVFAPHTKRSQFRSLYWNQVNFMPYMNQVNSVSNTKTKSFSTPRQNPSKLRSPHKNQVSLDPCTKTKLVPIKRIKPSRFWSPHQNQVNSDPYLEIKSSLISHNGIKSTSTTHPNNQVKFDAHTKTKWF